MSITITLHTDKPRLPTKKKLRSWMEYFFAQLNVHEKKIEVDFVTSPKIRGLNKRFRNKNKATNVLAFPTDIPLSDGEKFLGNIILCPAIIEKEAIDQNKIFYDHLMHLMLHGLLHLLGFDHETPRTATKMETLEKKLLASLEIPNPYE